MSHHNKKSLKQQVNDRFESMFMPGRSKRFDKRNGTKGYIYSYSTRKTYQKLCCYFVDWVAKAYQSKMLEIAHRPRTLEDCLPFAGTYLMHLVDDGLSPWTIKTAACSLSKLYGCSINDFDIDLPKRRRQDITRSRGCKLRDRHFSEENHQDFVEFCRATGLRRNEIVQLRGSDLRINGSDYQISVSRGAKGGRHRVVPIVGSSATIDMIVRTMQHAGSGRVWPKVPSCDIHGYRADYAVALYRSLGTDDDPVPRMYRYCCRNEMRGKVFDKRKMMKVSAALGHNRLGVVVVYLRDL